jgi:hypothetical protein
MGDKLVLNHEYRPENPTTLDAKLSVSTTLYCMHIDNELRPKDINLIIEILEYLLGFYQNNGFPSGYMTEAPNSAVFNAINP